MPEKFTFTIELEMDADDLNMHITTEGEGIQSLRAAAIASFFKAAMSEQANTTANLAVEYGRLAQALSDAQDDFE